MANLARRLLAAACAAVARLFVGLKHLIHLFGETRLRTTLGFGLVDFGANGLFVDHKLFDDPLLAKR